MCIPSSVAAFIFTVSIIFSISYFTLMIISSVKSFKSNHYWKFFYSKDNTLYRVAGLVAGILFFVFVYNGSKANSIMLRLIYWLCGVLFFAIAMYIGVYKTFEGILQEWAKGNNYRLLNYRPCFFGEGVGGPFSIGNQRVFKITLKDNQGAIHQAYFFFGSYWGFDPANIRVEFID